LSFLWFDAVRFKQVKCAERKKGIICVDLWDLELRGLKIMEENKGKGFTLIEIIIVVVLIALIAAFGIPGYGKLIRKSHERNAILGLTAINKANEVYEVKNGGYFVGAGGLGVINPGLSIDVKALDLTYSYTGVAGSYTATAAWTGSSPFTVGVDENPIILATNPSCSVGPCPTLP